MEFIVETSARHVHLTKEDIRTLFGKEELTFKKDLSQPGQFACEERVTLVAEKKGVPTQIKNVIVLGPARPASQVELSFTDARTIGVSAPIRESGDVAGSAPCKLVNPENGAEYELSEGVIIAKRHIHLTPETAAEMGVADKQIVSVKINSERTTVYGDVVVRVSEKFAPAMHIDTDEANAACAFGNVMGEVIA